MTIKIICLKVDEIEREKEVFMPIFKARVKIMAGLGDRKFIDARIEAKNSSDAKKQFELTYGKENIASTIRQER